MHRNDQIARTAGLPHQNPPRRMPWGGIWQAMLQPSIADRMQPFVVNSADGVHVVDARGRLLLDGQSGLWCVNVGHRHPRVVEAIKSQLDRLAYYNSMGDTTHPGALSLADRLLDLLAPEDMNRVLFCAGGAESVETAMKVARHYWRLRRQPARQKFISLERGFHGSTYGSASVAGEEIFRAVGGAHLSGCSRVPAPCLYRNPWTENPQELANIVADLVAKEIEAQGPNTVAAFIAEPVQFSGGCIVPPPNFWSLIRTVCDRYDVLLIADEVVTGFGRTGHIFGTRGWGVRPDIMCFAKGLSGGYVPLGATVINKRVTDAWRNAGREGKIAYGYTFGAHPLACAAAHAVLDIIDEQQLPARAASLGAELLNLLRPLVDRFRRVGDVRGRGLMLGIELVDDPQTRAPVTDPQLVRRILGFARKEGLVLGGNDSTILIGPPLVIEHEHVEQIASMLTRAMERARI